MGGVGGGSPGKENISKRVRIFVDGRPFYSYEAMVFAGILADHDPLCDRTYSANGYVEGGPDDEDTIPLKVDQRSIEKLRAKLIPCPAFEHAGLSMMRSLTDDEEGIAPNDMRSYIWQSLHRIRRLFENHHFDWVDLAFAWKKIEELALVGENVDEMIERVNEILKFWMSCRPKT